MSNLLNIQHFVREYAPQTERFGGAFGIALQMAQKAEPPPPEPQVTPDNDPLIHEVESVVIGEDYGYSMEALEVMNLELEDNPDVRVEADDIYQDIADGKSVDIVADERGLTRQQVLDQLESGGFEVVETLESTRVNDDILTTEITHPETGERVTVRYDKPEDTYRVSVRGADEDGGIPSSHRRDNQGRKITTETDDETGARTTRYEDDLGDGSTFEKTKLPSGVVIEATTDADGETTTVVIDEEGNRTTLEDGQETTREGIDGIAAAIAEGKSIDEIAEQQGVTREQLTAQQAEVIQTVIESMLAEESIPQLSETVEERQEDKQDAVDKYGEGQPGTGYNLPFGEPPIGTAPSGGKWVPMNGVWMDPEVAKAIAAENTALAELTEAQAAAGQAQAQMEVYALDPDYAQAIDDAGATIDEALAPHGLQWTRPEASGSLEDAQAARLDQVNTRVDAGQAKTDFQAAQGWLDEAITKQENMPDYPDETDHVLTKQGSDYSFQNEFEKGEAVQSEVDALFYEAALRSGYGKDLLAGNTISQP